MNVKHCEVSLSKNHLRHMVHWRSLKDKCLKVYKNLSEQQSLKTKIINFLFGQLFIREVLLDLLVTRKTFILWHSTINIFAPENVNCIKFTNVQKCILWIIKDWVTIVCLQLLGIRTVNVKVRGCYNSEWHSLDETIHFYSIFGLKG